MNQIDSALIVIVLILLLINVVIINKNVGRLARQLDEIAEREL